MEILIDGGILCVIVLAAAYWQHRQTRRLYDLLQEIKTDTSVARVEAAQTRRAVSK